MILSDCLDSLTITMNAGNLSLTDNIIYCSDFSVLGLVEHSLYAFSMAARPLCLKNMKKPWTCAALTWLREDKNCDSLIQIMI